MLGELLSVTYPMNGSLFRNWFSHEPELVKTYLTISFMAKYPAGTTLHAVTLLVYQNKTTHDVYATNSVP